MSYTIGVMLPEYMYRERREEKARSVVRAMREERREQLEVSMLEIVKRHYSGKLEIEM